MHLAIKVCVLDDEDEEENLKQASIILCLSSQQKQNNSKTKEEEEEGRASRDKFRQEYSECKIKPPPKKTRLVCRCGSIKITIHCDQEIEYIIAIYSDYQVVVVSSTAASREDEYTRRMF
jgi:hypothetical protein